MSLLQQLRSLILNRDLAATDLETISSIQTRTAPSWIEKYQSKILGCTVLGIIGYILYPSIRASLSKEEVMFTKRPDKHTTGFINMRNDCFANSSLQAYLALPGMVTYLNNLIDAYLELRNIIAEYLPQELEIDANSQTSDQKKKVKFEIPLHYSMARLLCKLQETRLSSKTISVWSVLHTLERIFNAKISKSQHDAQELTQLINETLESENLAIGKKYESLVKVLNKNNTALARLENIKVPDFPLNGLILTQMKCLKCSFVSTPSFSPFLMLTLNTPEVPSTQLSKMLNENKSESIESYQCLRCRIARIVEHEKCLEDQGNTKLSGEEESILKKLAALNSSTSLCINEDISEDLENYIKSYKKPGLDITSVTSTVFRKSQILKPPKIFGIHLSRSSFDGINVTRNPCSVSFKDHLTLTIGKEYREELRNFQEVAREENLLADALKSKVLTQDVNDMVDEDAQREDIDEEGDEQENENGQGLQESNQSDSDSNDETEKELLNDTSDTDSSTSVETDPSAQVTSSSFQTSSKGSDLTGSNSSRGLDTLNNTPISEAQTKNLKKQFRSFKFNDNDVYKYKLRAVIRHFGTHALGHYECYRRKPLFLKDKEGNIIKLFPEIAPEALAPEVATTTTKSSKVQQNETLSSSNSILNNSTSTDSSGRSRKFSLSFGNNKAGLDASSNIPTNSQRPQNDNLDSDNYNQGIRKKFSEMIGRRPSIIHANLPQDNKIQEIFDPNLNTPAEIVVHGLKEDYFSSGNPNGSNEVKENDTTKDNIRMRKLPSVIKHPFWKVSDSQVTEVSTSAVLQETSTVYMLYYERIDRKQVKT